MYRLNGKLYYRVAEQNHTVSRIRVRRNIKAIYKAQKKLNLPLLDANISDDNSRS